MKPKRKLLANAHISLWQRGKMWELIPKKARPLYVRVLFYLLSEADYRSGVVAKVTCDDIKCATGASDVKPVYAVIKALEADGFIAVTRSKGCPYTIILRTDFWRKGQPRESASS